MTSRKMSVREQQEAEPFTKESLYRSLGAVETRGIQFLISKISTDIKTAARKGNMSPEEVEELINDVVVITIRNIRKGTFQFVDFHPATYALGVARKLLANYFRKKKLPTVELENGLQVPSEDNPELYLRYKERQAMVETLFNQLGETCRNLLKMKFFEQLNDQEIMDQNRTAFTNLNSLRSKRSQCLKKLTELALKTDLRKIV